MLRDLYRRLAAAVLDRVGSLHAGAMARSLYVARALAPVLGPSGRAFDAGCGGPAHVARLLARRLPRWRVVGVDLAVTPDGALPANLSLCVGDLQALPVAGPFDLVYSIDVLEHVADPARLLADLAGRLREGGVLLVHVPARHQRRFLPGVDYEHSWLGPPRAGDAHLVEGFEPGELRAWVERAGLDVVLSRHTFGTAVGILHELFLLGAERRVPGVGLLLFPAVALATALEWRWGGRRGNGLLVVARRRAASGARP